MKFNVVCFCCSSSSVVGSVCVVVFFVFSNKNSTETEIKMKIENWLSVFLLWVWDRVFWGLLKYVLKFASG